MVPDVLALHETGLGDSPVKVFGGVALNPQVGGINPYAVDLALNKLAANPATARAVPQLRKQLAKARKSLRS